MNKKECNFPIDFVIPWVDGADLEWKNLLISIVLKKNKNRLIYQMKDIETMVF